MHQNVSLLTVIKVLTKLNQEK